MTTTYVSRGDAGGLLPAKWYVLSNPMAEETLYDRMRLSKINISAAPAAKEVRKPLEMGLLVSKVGLEPRDRSWSMR